MELECFSDPETVQSTPPFESRWISDGKPYFATPWWFVSHIMGIMFVEKEFCRSHDDGECSGRKLHDCHSLLRLYLTKYK